MSVFIVQGPPGLQRIEGNAKDVELYITKQARKRKWSEDYEVFELLSKVRATPTDELITVKVKKKRIILEAYGNE